MIKLDDQAHFYMSSNILSETNTPSHCQLHVYDPNSQITARKDDNQIEFVSQFLELDKNQQQMAVLTEQKSREQPSGGSGSSSERGEESPNLENSSQTKRTRSIFHNFQKHLVTTLKINISMTKANPRNDPTIALAQKMWRIFHKSNYFSKKILHFLFGVTVSSRAQKNLDPRSKIFPGFQEIVTTYSSYSIEQAQQYLRLEVYRQGKRLLTKNLCSNRRMQKSEEFESYFRKFLEEIENGAISKRLPKPSKIDLLDHLNRGPEESY